MQGEQLPAATTNATTSQTRLTLKPLLSDGPDALHPNLPDILKIKLREAEVARDNEFHEVTIWRSDDIFASSSASGCPHPLPEDGNLVRAAFAIFFVDSPKPHSVEICPPSTLKLECPSDAPRVHAWLAKCRFTVLQKAALALLALTLALANTTALPLDDDDDDDDDGDSDPVRLHACIPHKRAHLAHLTCRKSQNTNRWLVDPSPDSASIPLSASVHAQALQDFGQGHRGPAQRASPYSGAACRKNQPHPQLHR